jgi:anti-sigma factor RsiW
MNDKVPITNEDLVAYLDDAIDPARKAEIDATLASDRSLGIRLAGLDIDKKRLRAAFDDVAAAAPTGRLLAQLEQPAAPQRRGRPRWIAIAAALMMGVALGYGMGSNKFFGPAESWQEAIANYQMLYTSETLTPITSDPAKQRRDVADIAAKLGWPIKFEALQVPGLDFKRVQLLSFEGRPLAQFSYLDPSGIPIAFCATRTGDGDSAIKTGRFRELDAAFWSKNGFGFIVIGAAQTDALRRTAAQLAEQI